MKATYSLYHTGLLDKAMDIKTKLFIYKAYCRPSLTYGLELIDLNEKNMNMLRTDEGIIIKRILSISKRSKTTLSYQTMQVLEIFYLCILMKWKLMRRLESHEYTKQIIHEIINLNRNKQVQNSQ